jgi:hypothetical protein
LYGVSWNQLVNHPTPFNHPGRRWFPFIRVALVGNTATRSGQDHTVSVLFLVVLILSAAIGAVLGGVIGLTIGLMTSPGLYAIYGVLAGGFFGFFVGLIIVIRAGSLYAASLWRRQTPGKTSFLRVAAALGAVPGAIIGLAFGWMSSPVRYASYGILAGGILGFSVGLIVVARE